MKNTILQKNINHKIKILISKLNEKVISKMIILGKHLSSCHSLQIDLVPGDLIGVKISMTRTLIDTVNLYFFIQVTRSPYSPYFLKANLKALNEI